jgi:predicted Zn-ribbon and HTH transcriptional regulator
MMEKTVSPKITPDKWEDTCVLCGRDLIGRGTKDWYAAIDVAKVKQPDQSFFDGYPFRLPVCRSIKRCLEPEKNRLLRAHTGHPDYASLIKRELSPRTFHCLWCNQDWTTTSHKKPKYCGNCGSVYWNEKKPPILKCLQCGHQWVNHKGTTINRCPNSKCRSIYWGIHNPPTWHCLKCDNKWTQNEKEMPKRCPKCQSTSWNYPPLIWRDVTCSHCRYKWRTSSRFELPRCPKCKS